MENPADTTMAKDGSTLSVQSSVTKVKSTVKSVVKPVDDVSATDPPPLFSASSSLGKQRSQLSGPNVNSLVKRYLERRAEEAGSRWESARNK
jgi:hypothetical protein